MSNPSQMNGNGDGHILSTSPNCSNPSPSSQEYGVNTDTLPSTCTPTKSQRHPPLLSSPLPPLVNDEGAPVQLITNISRSRHRGQEQQSQHFSIYCGRYLGAGRIPNSDGFCGPKDGPPCPSCLRLLERGGGIKKEILKRVFPALVAYEKKEEEEKVGMLSSPTSVIGGSIENGKEVKVDIFTALLRNSYGIVSDAIKFLTANDSCIAIDPQDALSPRSVFPPKNTTDQILVSPDAANSDHVPTHSQLIEGLAEATAVTTKIAEYALETMAYNTDDAMDWLLSSTRQKHLNEAELELVKREKEVSEFNAKREECIQEALSKGVKWDELLKKIPISFTPLHQQSPDITSISTTNGRSISISSVSSTCTIASSSSSSMPPMIVQRGHRMVLVKHDTSDNSSSVNCVLCSEAIPSTNAGSYQCSACSLCEGCIQSTIREEKEEEAEPTRIVTEEEEDATAAITSSPSATKEESPEDVTSTSSSTIAKPLTAWTCPAVRNGGHLHRHPMIFDPTRFHRCVCDINGPNCHNHGKIVWTCHECDFDVCMACAREEAPKNYCRKEGTYNDENVDETAETEDDFVQGFSFFFDDDDANVEEEEEEEENEEAVKNLRRQSLFNEGKAQEAISSCWARKWYTNTKDGNTSQVYIGSGTVGQTTVIQEEEQNPDVNNDNQIVPFVKGSPIDGPLCDDAEDALTVFQGGFEMGLDNQLGISATDRMLAEDILRRISQEDNSDLSREKPGPYSTLLNAVSSGNLGTASQLLLANAYSPTGMCIPTTCIPCTDQVDEGNDVVPEITCWCGEVIDSKTAPDGVVGCLQGHAMHASCASDLMLGGGKCPTCRQTIFFPKLASTECQTAVDFAVEHSEKEQQVEEQKIQDEIKEITDRGGPISYDVGDIVFINGDRKQCKYEQLRDPISGSWHDEMSDACGREGRINEVVRHDGRIVSIRLVSHGQHEYRRIKLVDDYKCSQCDRSRDGQRRCTKCKKCEKCCRQVAHQECTGDNQDWFWSPKLCSLRRRGNGMPIGPTTSVDNSTVAEAEKCILRLRGELIAVKKAREEIKADMEDITVTSITPKDQGPHTLTSDIIKSGISSCDMLRARHLLELIEQWGDSTQERAQRLSIYNELKEGNVDTVARIIRRYNASRTSESLKWIDASEENTEYIVEPLTRVDLHAFPNINAPKTGFSLQSGFVFRKKNDVLDESKDHWIEVGGDEAAESSDIEKKEENDDSTPCQGWFRVRPSGDGSPAVVRRTQSNLKCFCCGDRMISDDAGDNKYETVKQSEIKEGDILLVAATLERVRVERIERSRIHCSFPESKSAGYTIWYRASDLVKQKNLYYNAEETISIDGRQRTRRELLLSFGGDKVAAQKAWDNGKKLSLAEDEQNFASCVKGHVFHARCLTGLMLDGKCCPVDGCNERLFLPSVTRVNNDDETCCGGASNDSGAEDEALQAALDFAGHSSTYEDRIAEGATVATSTGTDQLKMCPNCFAGPLFNRECSDMAAHHGQCVERALNGSQCGPCTEDDGDFRANASDIAARMAQVSKTVSVADVLPRCPKHNCIVMFNGCMSCGHLFTDINWNELPEWNPANQYMMEVDKKRTHTARLLTEQIRTEAASLQFERDISSRYVPGD